MLRKIVSLTALLSFLVTLLTSVILYIVPHGRVAYWADWTFLWLTKDDWGATHITTGTLFIAAILLHLWLNWKPLVAYLKNKARELSLRNPSLIVALALTVFVFAGTLLGLPPMRQILDFSASIKEDATRIYGNPPYGHAELSPLNKFCAYLGLDAEKAAAALREAGYALDNGTDTEIQAIARSKGESPQQVYESIRAGLGGAPVGLPANPPEGLGRLSLEQVCATYGLSLEETVARLAAKSIKADGAMTLKEIAAGANLTPRDVYAILRGE